MLATAATGFMAGCGVGEDEDEQVAYCTDEDGEIVDDDFCDDDYNGGGGLFFLYLGGFRSGLPVGTGSRRAARGSTRATRRRGSGPGCPATGAVSGGTRVAGGIGSGLGGRSAATGAPGAERARDGA